MSAPVVAVIGGGQLARMMQAPAAALDIHLRILAEGPQVSAAQVVPDAPVGQPTNTEEVAALVEGAQVLTFEHEHVPYQMLRDLEQRGMAVRPCADALAHAQDKLTMRRRMTELGVPCPRWAQAVDVAQVVDFAREVGWPVVVKTARGGYDGKGVMVLRSEAEARDSEQLGQWIARLGDESAATGSGAAAVLLVEEFMTFRRELSMLVARRPSGGTEGRGEIRLWPVVETIQENGVCAAVLAPAPDLPAELEAQCERIGRAVAEGLDVTGVLAVELFEVDGADGQARVVVNELAMRPHNSGHWTIDGAVTSQFEQHLRAVLDWPLGSPDPIAPAAVMVNLLGSELADVHDAYPELLERFPEAKVQLYGKEVRPGRKLGHVTIVGDSLAEAHERARAAAALLRG